MIYMNDITYPTPVDHDSRISFGIDYFATEEEAEIAHSIVRERGDTANGGYFHGMPLGRDDAFDRLTDEGVKLYAVKVA